MHDPMIHRLKTVNPWFKYLWEGSKLFEVRYDDRGFGPGDLLILSEWDEDTGFTGRHCARRVGLILSGEQYGLMRGFVVMGLYPQDAGWNWEDDRG